MNLGEAVVKNLSRPLRAAAATLFVASLAAATLVAATPTPVGAATGAPYPTGPGYWLAAADGGIFSFGGAVFEGSTGGIHLNKPVVGGAPTPFLEGYWLVATDGGIFSFGSAGFFGSSGAITLNKPVVGMAAHPSGLGYWLVASDGGIFSYGASKFKGSTGAITLNKPIVGMAATPDGGGYWLVASDGGIFAFGDATFFGSTGGIKLNKPIVGMSTDDKGDGYQLVATDGGVFTFGNMAFLGSTGSMVLNQPINSLMLRPVPAVKVDPYAPTASGSQSSNWVTSGTTQQLTLTKTGADSVAAGARVLGVAGFTVAQLGKIGFTSVSGTTCDGTTPYFLLEATNAAGGVDQGTYACTAAGLANTFDPVAGTGGKALPSTDVVNSLDIVQPKVTTASLTNIAIGGSFGVIVSSFRTYRSDGTTLG